ncbi:MAG: MBL fold metallo-hydrolase [Patescibacteria group bacterium]
MILTYHEGFCIRAQAGDTTVVFGPVSKASKNFKPTNFGADVAFVSLNHPDMNGIEEAGRGDKQPFVISGPGEYEIKDIAAFGFPSTSQYGGSECINTLYSVTFDGLSVFYAGAIGTTALPKDLEDIDPPDILIVPVGDEGALTPAEAQKLAVNLEAKIVIPVGFNEKTLKQFLKEAGAEGVKPEEKLTLKKKDVAGKENEVVVLKA